MIARQWLSSLYYSDTVIKEKSVKVNILGAFYTKSWCFKLVHQHTLFNVKGGKLRDSDGLL